MVYLGARSRWPSRRHHGRQADNWERTILHHIDPRLWSKVERAWKEHGFGYVETERNAAGSYGYNLTAPSWVLNLVENDPSCRVLGFEEAAWNDHQDAIILQRRPSA
jgi:hypothetical protein